MGNKTLSLFGWMNRNIGPHLLQAIDKYLQLFCEILTYCFKRKKRGQVFLWPFVSYYITDPTIF